MVEIILVLCIGAGYFQGIDMSGCAVRVSRCYKCKETVCIYEDVLHLQNVYKILESENKKLRDALEFIKVNNNLDMAEQIVIDKALAEINGGKHG